MCNDETRNKILRFIDTYTRQHMCCPSIREITAAAGLKSTSTTHGYIKTVCDAFSYGAYQRRNEWMVNHSDRVIAVYSGEAGGTRNTIDYAKKQGVSLVMIDG